MSILIRTGSGKTDLAYTDKAVKDLKVLQKTGARSVQWITTKAGTTYNNILQKRGVKDLYYGGITIPSDEPAWYGNPESGQKVSWVFEALPEWSTETKPKTWRTKKGNLADNGWNYKQGDDMFTTTAASEDYFSIYFFRTGRWQSNIPYPTPQMEISKLFIVDVNNPSRKAVYLLSRYGNWGVSNEFAESSYYSDYTIRNSYVTIDNFLDGGTYRVGIRATDS